MAAKMKFTPKRKLSGKDILGVDTRSLWKQEMKKNPDITRLDVYTIGGRANKYDTVDSPYGESLRLVGDFLAVNAFTKEVFRSNRCFLPGIMTDAIVAQLATMDSRDTSVEFGYTVYLTPDEKSGTGYIYMFEPLIEAEESNIMLNIAEKIGAKSAMLPMTEPAKQLSSKK